MLIGISGKAGAGKSTLGNMLSKLSGYPTLGLADTLKQKVNTIFGWDNRHSFGSLKEEEQYTKVTHISQINLILNTCWNGIIDMDYDKLRAFYTVFEPYVCFDNMGFIQWKISPRKAYQLFGTEFGRKQLKDTLWLDLAQDHDIIWTDVRFDNEAEYLKSKGGILIEVVSDRETTKESSHSSEAGVDKSYISITIDNTGTLKKLEKEAEKVWKVIQKTQ